MRSWLRDHFFREIKERKETEKAFLENGSKLLEKLIASCNGKPIPIRSFSTQELCQSTHNYHDYTDLGMYRYKGSLEGRIVLIKLFPDSESSADFAINDLVISAQMCAHNNVLKPIGCCLENQPPILVYEFPKNGFLADRIYICSDTRQHRPMAWESRLKIARQIAHAISYLHTAFSRPVIHMAIHMHSILLDEHDVPKFSNFFFSVTIPEGETDVEAYNGLWHPKFKGPEFEAIGKATEKFDVYHFGVLLMELLTGEDSYNTIRLIIDEDSSLVEYMHNCAQGYSIIEIVDPAILAGEGRASLEQQLQAVLDLALTCTEEDPYRRPTMLDVTKELKLIERYVT